MFYIIEDIETSSGLFGITQAFALLHVVRRQEGNLFISFERTESTLNTWTRYSNYSFFFILTNYLKNNFCYFWSFFPTPKKLNSFGNDWLLEKKTNFNYKWTTNKNGYPSVRESSHILIIQNFWRVWCIF